MNATEKPTPRQKGSKRKASAPRLDGLGASACSLLIDGLKYIIREVDIHTKTRFEARYKGNYITVWLDDDEDEYQDQDEERDWSEWYHPEPQERRYYIRVENPEESFGTKYDGWASEEAETLEDAIKEALRGSCLLRENTEVRQPETKPTTQADQ